MIYQGKIQCFPYAHIPYIYVTSAREDDTLTRMEMFLEEGKGLFPLID